MKPKNPGQRNLGVMLKLWRESKGLGVRGAAQRLNVSGATVSRIETGKMTPDSEVFVKILQWLMEPVNGNHKKPKRRNPEVVTVGKEPDTSGGS
jgi:transcriptional regulator with XRE-family HTH domain